MKKISRPLILFGLLAHLTYGHAATGIANAIPNVPNSVTNPAPGGFILANQYISASILKPNPITGHHYPMINSLSILGTTVIPQANAGAEFAFALRTFTGKTQTANPTAGGDCAGNASELLDFQFDTATLNKYINYLPEYNTTSGGAKIPGSPAMGMLLKIRPREYGGDAYCGSSVNYPITNNLYPSRIDLLDSNLPAGTPVQRQRSYDGIISGNAYQGKRSNYIFETGFVLGTNGSMGAAYPNNGIHPLAMLFDLKITPVASNLLPPPFHRRHVEVPSIFVDPMWSYAYYGNSTGNFVTWSPMVPNVNALTNPYKIASNNAYIWDTASWDPTTNDGVNLVALCNRPVGQGETCVALFSMKKVYGTVSSRVRSSNLIQLSLTGGNMSDFGDGNNSTDWVDFSTQSSVRFRRLLAFGNVATINDAISKSILAGHFNGYY